MSEITGQFSIFTDQSTFSWICHELWPNISNDTNIFPPNFWPLVPRSYQQIFMCDEPTKQTRSIFFLHPLFGPSSSPCRAAMKAEGWIHTAQARLSAFTTVYFIFLVGEETYGWPGELQFRLPSRGPEDGADSCGVMLMRALNLPDGAWMFRGRRSHIRRNEND